MVHLVATPLEALWAFLSGWAGLMVSAVAAHPVWSVLGALYVAGWAWFTVHIAKAPTEDPTPPV
jgi:hypothetical protein